jgi:hypothetical protein
MKSCYRCLRIVCFLVVPLLASAQDSKTPLVTPDNFQFTGKWDCEGTFRNNQVHKSIYTGEMILGGKWLELTETDTQPATGYLAKYLIGYDPHEKRLIEFDASNFGAATYSSELGWQKGILIMNSPVSQDAKAPYAANRFVYTVTGKDSFTVDWQISRTSALAWTPADHLACKMTTQG